MSKQTIIKLQKNLSNLIDIKEDKLILYGGILGTYDSLGNEIVDVPGRSNFSFVRLNGSLGEVIEAFNITVAADFGLKVKITKKPGEFFYEVIGLDLAQYSNWGEGGANPFLPKHAFTHAFGAGTNVGTDPVFIYKRQLLQPLGMQPVGTGTAFYGYVNPDFYIWNNDIRYFEGSFTANLSGLKPTNSQSRYVTIYLDGTNGVLAYKTGSLFNPPGTVAAAIAEIPEVNIINEGLPLNAVYLTSGTTSVNWDNMFDIRNFLNAGGQIGAATGSSSSGGTTVTGIADGAVVFGSPTGTILWDGDNFKYLNSTDQLLIGTSSLPFSTNSRLLLSHTGTFAGITAVGYGADGGSFFGRAVAGSVAIPSGTQALKRLLNFEGAGHDMSGFTAFKSRLAAISQYAWKTTDTPTYWEMWSTPTGSTTAEVVHRWWGMYEESNKPHHMENLRIGTGSIYSQFIKSPGQTVIIPYVLPPAQGAASSFLGNDGNGNLSWIVITVTGSGGDIMSGYPTGVPDNVVIFGKTGTISWDINNFVFLDSTDQLFVGYNGNVDDSTLKSSFTVYKTGAVAQAVLHALGNNLGGEFVGVAVGTAPGENKGPTQAHNPLVKLIGLGYEGVDLVTGSVLSAHAAGTWAAGGINASYWQMVVTTGSVLEKVARWYYNKEELYKPLHLGSYLQFGTGSIYSRFSNSPSLAGAVNYVLPSAQGAALTFLGNDGSGNLSWAIPAVTGSSAGSATGIPNGAVVFGQTGNIGWDANHFYFNDSVNQLVLGYGATFPAGAIDRMIIIGTGNLAPVTYRAIHFGNQGGRFLGQAMGGDISNPTGVLTNYNLVSLEGWGHNGTTDTGVRARIVARARYTWTIPDCPTYWEIQSTPTGSIISQAIQRIYGEFEEHYFPVHVDKLRFGTGSIYTQFSSPTGSNAIIPYKLPEAQGASLTFLRNDGSGNLSWAIPSVTGSSSNDGGYPTGIPAEAVLFGGGGTITWDTANFIYKTAGDQLLLGLSSSPIANSSRLAISQTGTAAKINLIGYQASGGEIGGILAGGTPASPSATPAEKLLLHLIGGGHDGTSFTETNAALAAISKYLWNADDKPTYWQFRATPTGSATPNIIQRIYGNFEEHYHPVHVDILRFGTGSVYTQFSKNSSQAAIIPYVLPTGQGAATSYLQNDGSGQLQWKTIAGVTPGGYPTGIPDNLILYGIGGTIGYQTDFLISDGRIGLGRILGAQFPLATLHTSFEGTSYWRGYLQDQYSNDSLGGLLTFRKSRGSPGSESPVLKNDSIGELKWNGYDSTSLSGTVAQIKGIASENFGGARGARLEFYATATGSANIIPVAVLHGSYEEHFQPVHLENLRVGTGSVYSQFTKNSSQTAIIPYVLPTGQGGAGSFLGNNGSGQLQWTTPAGSSPGGYPTGIPDSVVLFGAGGTIAYDTAGFVWNDASNYLGIGLATPLASLHVQQTGSTLFRGILTDQYTNDVEGSNLWIRKARGTPGSPSAVQKSDILGELRFTGYDGSSLTGVVSSLKVLAQENFGGARGTRTEFYNTVTGSANPTLGITLFGNYEEHYTPSHFDTLRIGTGSVYSQFKNSTSQPSTINYVLPTGQNAFSTFLRNDGSGNLDWNENNVSLTFIVDGGGSVITTGTKGDLEIPFGCVIQRVTMLADVTGTLVMDIWKDTYANYPPTSADSIVSSAPPKIATGTKSQDSTLTGWTTTVTAGDTLRFQVNSISNITRATLSLKVRKV